MTTKEIANNLVKWCNEGNEARCYQELYAPEIQSIEATGEGDMGDIKGMEAIQKKGEWWFENFEVHSSKASGPMIADNWFSVQFQMDTTHKPSGQRSVMNELAVYQVQDGKIVREQFFYDQGK